MSKKKIYDNRPVENKVIRKEIQQLRQSKVASNQGYKRKQPAAR